MNTFYSILALLATQFLENKVEIVSISGCYFVVTLRDSLFARAAERFLGVGTTTYLYYYFSINGRNIFIYFYEISESTQT